MPSVTKQQILHISVITFDHVDGPLLRGFPKLRGAFLEVTIISNRDHSVLGPYWGPPPFWENAINLYVLNPKL